MITTLSGTNEFSIENELKNILSKFKENNSYMAIEQIDLSETDYQAVFEIISNLSFLSPNKLVILRRGSSNKSFIDSIDEIISSVPPTTDLVIVEPNLDKRLAYFKSLKKLTEFNSYEELDARQITDWIVKTVTTKQGSVKSRDAEYLAEICGMNQMRISNEINKLLNYQKEISKQAIDLLVEPVSQSTIFQLLDAAFSGRSEDLLKIYDDQRKQKVEPQQIISMLTWQIHILAIIKASGNDSPNEIARKTKISPFVISKSLSIAKKLSMNDIRELTSKLLGLDVKLKNRNIDIDEALLQLLLSIYLEVIIS